MYRRSFNLADYVLPRLRQLVSVSGECAGLYVREGEQRVCLHHVQPHRAVRLHVIEGKQFSLDVGAAGHVIRAIGDRKSVVEGKRVSVSVALGGRGRIKKKK